MSSIFKRTKTTVDSGNITISYSILGLGFIILILIIGGVRLLDFLYKWNLELRDYISMSTFGCVTIGLIYNATALQYNYEVNKIKLESETRESKGKKVKITYEAVSEWYKGDMASNAEVARRFIQPFKGKLNNSEILINFKNELKIDENIHVRKSITSVLNYFEHLSLLCADNVIDEEILRKAFRTAFVTYYLNLKEYIEDEQRGNDGANSKIFINFVEITKKWLYN